MTELDDWSKVFIPVVWYKLRLQWAVVIPPTWIFWLMITNVIKDVFKWMKTEISENGLE